MIKLLIRELTSEDIPSVARIELMSFTTPWSEKSLFSEVYKTNSISRVASHDGTIAGYIFVQHVLDEGHLLDLAIHPDYQRLGVATALLMDVIAELRLRKCRFLYLEVRASNHAAIRLYSRAGFRKVNFRKDYYNLPAEDAIVMAMELAMEL